MQNNIDMSENTADKNSIAVIAIDDTENSLHAFQWYIKYFHRPNYTVALAHVYTLPEKTSYGTGRHNTVLETMHCKQHDEDTKKVLEEHSELVKKFQNICAESNVTTIEICMERRGSIGETLCEIVKEHQACCIIMGQRGCSMIKRAIHGCVSEYVTKHAKNTAVIVVKPNE